MNIDLNAIVVKSSFMHFLTDGDFSVIWHALFGRPKIVPNDTLEFIEQFSKPTTIREQLGETLTDEDHKALKELFDCYFLVPDDFDERALLEQKKVERESEIANGSLINYLELIMSEACNFGCTYCIHFGNLENSERLKSKNRLMQFGTACKMIDIYLEILARNQKRVAEINFGGGEPLLAWTTIKQVLEYCSAVYGRQFEFHFTLNTNASLISQEVAEVLKEYNVEIAISIDGLREWNDRVRLTKSGDGTFLSILKGAEELALAGYPVGGFSVTVTEDNFDGLDESLIDWAVSNKMNEVRVDIDVVGTVGINIENIIEKLLRIRNYASKKGVEVPGFWSRPAENLNESALESRVAFCGAARGNSLCVTPSGDIYGCGYSNIQLGTISEIQSFYSSGTPYHRFVKDHETGSADRCKGCMIEGQCAGGCNITQEFALAAGTAKIERMCDLYRRMTQEILREQLRGATV